MKASSLHNKTVRPGSLNGYSYYYSSRTPRGTATVKPAAKRSKGGRRKLAVVVIMIAVAAAGFTSYSNQSNNSTAAKTPAQQPSDAQHAPAAASAAVNHCSGNKLDKLVKVDTAARHLWACEGAKSVYDTKVITGMTAHASTVTPDGTYHIYGKQSNVTLTGSDETGSWNDPVYYWMPFLDNEYGTYGFHDATWREDTAFGTVSPDSSNASHGCVELPLSASKWLFAWTEVGTTLTIES